MRDYPTSHPAAPRGADSAVGAFAAGWSRASEPTIRAQRLALRCDDGAVPNGSPGDVMRAMVAAFDSGEIDAVDDVVHYDYLDHQGLPHDRPIRGVKGFIRVVEAARSGYVDLSAEIADLIEGDDRRRPSRVVRHSQDRRSGSSRDHRDRQGHGGQGGRALGRALLTRPRSARLVSGAPIRRSACRR